MEESPNMDLYGEDIEEMDSGYEGSFHRDILSDINGETHQYVDGFGRIGFQYSEDGDTLYIQSEPSKSLIPGTGPVSHSVSKFDVDSEDIEDLVSHYMEKIHP